MLLKYKLLFDFYHGISGDNRFTFLEAGADEQLG
jgi:hypothetical protein